MAACLQKLTAKSLRELRGFNRPPGALKTILEATAVALGASDTQTWVNVRKALHGNILERMRDVELEEISSTQSAQLRTLVALPDFDEELVRSVCPTAVPLARWCRTIGLWLEGKKALEQERQQEGAAISGSASGLPARGKQGRREPSGAASGSGASGNGLTIKPDLSRLSAQDLQQVCELEVSRPGVGGIVFHGITNCKGLDIASLVHLDIGEVLVYPVQNAKPPPGQGLNKRATVTMSQCWPPNGRGHLDEPEAQQRYSGKIRKMTEENHAKFIDYNCATGVWKFEVEHF
jgi:nuclear pore complex protein Nup98-Nup96